MDGDKPDSWPRGAAQQPPARGPACAWGCGGTGVPVSSTPASSGDSSVLGYGRSTGVQREQRGSRVVPGMLQPWGAAPARTHSPQRSDCETLSNARWWQTGGDGEDAATFPRRNDSHQHHPLSEGKGDPHRLPPARPPAAAGAGRVSLSVRAATFWGWGGSPMGTMFSGRCQTPRQGCPLWGCDSPAPLGTELLRRDPLSPTLPPLGRTLPVR